MSKDLLAVDLQAIEQAADTIAGVAWRTPLLPASRDDDDLFVKLECLQRTGSFKMRGAWNRMSRMTDDERGRGVVTVSAGNHGQAVAWCARRLGVPCTVWVPDEAVERKVSSMESMGATVRRMPHDEIMDIMATRELPVAEGATYIHPFGDPLVLAGQGTVGLEIARDLDDVGTVLVPVGGGGLSCGVATAVKALHPRAKVFGVQAASADPVPQSFAAGRRVAVGPPETFADGMAATRVFEYMWPVLQDRLDGAFTVDDAQLERAVVHLASECHVVVEGAGAAALAAAWAHRDELDGPVVAVASGGNLDPKLLAGFLGA